MKILEFPTERTPAGKVAALTRQVELLLAEKQVVGLLLDHVDRLSEARDALKPRENFFRRDQIQPAFNAGRVR